MNILRIKTPSFVICHNLLSHKFNRQVCKSHSYVLFFPLFLFKAKKIPGCTTQPRGMSLANMETHDVHPVIYSRFIDSIFTGNRHFDPDLLRFNRLPVFNNTLIPAPLGHCLEQLLIIIVQNLEFHKLLPLISPIKAQSATVLRPVDNFIIIL